MTNHPRVSVVTATYNRSNVLRLTIESLLASTYTEWESIIVGDACTDDTAEVVASFADPRIRFVNLPQNSGDQATPNNEGVRLARGKYIAFLNHDDLWTRDHLEIAVHAIEETGADLVSTLTVAVDHHGVTHVGGFCPKGGYEPRAVVAASSWLMQRTLFDAVGPWRRAVDIYGSPSQDWLFRAWKQKPRLVSVARPTVLAVWSGGRKGSYAERQIDENARYAALLRSDPELLARLAQEVERRKASETSSAGAVLLRAAKNVVGRLAIAAGVHPASLRHAIIYRRKGGFIDSLRRTRGLPPLKR